MLDVEKIRGDFPILARVIWLSVAAPRQAVRDLLGAADIRFACWTLVITGTIATAIVSGIGSWFELRDATDISAFTFFDPSQITAEILSLSFIEAALILVSYPVTILLWTHVFGFRDRVQLVRVAVAVAFALMFFLSPVSEYFYYHFRSVDFSAAEMIVFLVSLGSALAFSSVYFAEALSIGVLRSLLINCAVTAMILIGFLILAVVVIFVYWGTIGLPGVGSP